MSAVLAAGVAAADPTPWRAFQNDYTKKWVEVWQWSTAPGAYVGTWDWNGSHTQMWKRFTVDQPGTVYRVEMNRNSSLVMSAQSQCSQGVRQEYVSSGGGAYPHQQWQELYTGNDTGWAFFNKTGCDGDVYHDQLSHSHDADYYPLYLYPENRHYYDDPPGCAIGTATWAPECFFNIYVAEG